MAQLYRCDCCNREVRFLESYAVNITDRMSMEVCDSYDLCKKCKKELVEDMAGTIKVSRV